MHTITLTWNRFKTVAGATRTWVDVDNVKFLDLYEKARDIASVGQNLLIWSAEVRFKGKRLPKTPEDTQQWLLDQSHLIRHGFDELAEKFHIGTNFEPWPLECPVKWFAKRVRIVVVFLPAGRRAGIDPAKILNDLANGWDEVIKNLPSALPSQVGDFDSSLDSDFNENGHGFPP